MDQCHKLIMEAYIQVGGLSMAKALLEGPVNHHQMLAITYHGVSVVNVETCLLQKKMFAAEVGHV